MTLGGQNLNRTIDVREFRQFKNDLFRRDIADDRLGLISHIKLFRIVEVRSGDRDPLRATILVVGDLDIADRDSWLDEG